MNKGTFPVRFSTKTGYLEIEFDLEWGLNCEIKWIKEQAELYVYLLQAKPETDSLH